MTEIAAVNCNQRQREQSFVCDETRRWKRRFRQFYRRGTYASHLQFTAMYTNFGSVCETLRNVNF